VGVAVVVAVAVAVVVGVAVRVAVGVAGVVEVAVAVGVAGVVEVSVAVGVGRLDCPDDEPPPHAARPVRIRNKTTSTASFGEFTNLIPFP
jgi:hypothetical protein